MSTKKKYQRYTITSALPYANGPAHIGHMAGAYLPADIFVRYLRSKGEDVLFICGSDEHGTAIEIQARREGTTPREIVNKYHEILKSTFAAFNISFDVYSRTSNPGHHETAQGFFRKFLDEGKFLQKTSEQLYDPEAQMFLADRYVVGTCPNCSSTEAYGNSCERCGSDLSPDQLIDPRSKVSGSTPVKRETTHWYLPLNDYQDWLQQYILEDHNYWKSNVYGQCKSWLQQDLHPRSITRDLSWGVSVPVADAEGKVLYVWFDAPIGYISATKEWAAAKGEDWEKWWKDEDSALIHFIGKDNIVFHCIIFPAILKGHGEYIFPENVPANEFLNLEGEKISTSKNWAVWLHEYLEEFPGQTDVLRYVLTGIMPETKDANFTWEDFKTRNDSELVDTFANFVNRVKVLTVKNFDGVPVRQELTSRDTQLLNSVQEAVTAAGNDLDNFRFREALNEMMKIARAGDLYLSDLEPWKLVKTDKIAAGHVLNLGLHVAAVLATVAEPFLPETAQKIFTLLGIAPVKWGQLGETVLVPEGGQLEKIPHLFSRIDKKVVQAQVDKLERRKAEREAEKAAAEAGGAEAPSIAPVKDMTTFDDFTQMDIRIGTIVEAEKLKKSKKLLKLLVDTGLDQRIILSGVAQHFAPEELVGKQCTVLLNLPARKMAGEYSHGMVLFAEDPSGKLHLVNPEYLIPPGSTVN
ncbi:MAG: methionine--tRNA ligase [Bacteroidota bacterium]